MAFDERKGLTIRSAIDTTYLDTSHFDVECSFPKPAFEDLDKLTISDVDGLRPFIMDGGQLKTQEITVSAHVSNRQELLLRTLYTLTVHPGYIDLRYPVIVTWGHKDNPVQLQCYLSNYVPPDSVNYKDAEILSVKLTLRAIELQPRRQ